MPDGDGGCRQKQDETKTGDSLPRPAAHGGRGGEPVRIQTDGGCVFQRSSFGQPVHGLPAGRSAELRAGNAKAGENRDGAVAVSAEGAANPDRIEKGVKSPAQPSAVADDRTSPATGTIAGQPLAVEPAGPAGLASVPGTWDKNNHGREGTPRNRYPAKAWIPRPRLRSSISDSSLKEKAALPSHFLAGFQSRIAKIIFTHLFSITCRQFSNSPKPRLTNPA